jgi:hypothetical protein
LPQTEERIIRIDLGPARAFQHYFPQYLPGQEDSSKKQHIQGLTNRRSPPASPKK